MILLQTLGAADLRRDGVEVRSVLSQPKRFALLVNLALGSPTGFASRDALLARFWPESDDERARNSLRQALHQLRRALGEDVLVNRGEREVGVAADRLRCDARDFQQALAEGRLEVALELYRGDFLPGFFVEGAPEVEAWMDEVRGHCRRQAATAAATLAEREETAGDVRTAALWARRALSIEPLDEAAARRLVRLLAAAGETAAALAAYDAFVAQLQAEHGVAPAPETRALADSVRAAATAPAPAPPHRPVPAESAGTAMPVATPEIPEPARPAMAAAPAMPVAASAVPPGDPGEPGAPTSPEAPRVRGSGDVAPDRRRQLSVRLAAAAGVVLLAFAGWQVREMAATPETAPAVAILPFASHGAEAGQEFLADALAEEVLSVLSRVPGLKVAARTSSFSFRGKEVAVDSVARALGVTHVVEGSVQVANGRMRVNVQLVEAATGFRIWSDSYDRPTDDLRLVQDEISRAVARNLQVELSPAVARPPANETRDPEAYRLVLRATQVMRGGSTRQVLTEASALFEEAVRRDPNYARALAGLANVLSWQANYRHIESDVGYARARELAERSLAIAPTVEAHIVLARDAELVRYDTAAADAHFRAALELNPVDPRTHQFRALFLSRNGRIDDGIVAARRAVELDPLHPGAHNNLAVVLREADRLEDARDAYEEALRVSPEDPIILENLGNLMARQERWDEALAYLDRALVRMPEDMQTLALRASVTLRAGRREEGLAMLRNFEARPDFARYRLAILYSNVGDVEKILDLLEQAVARREDGLLALRNPDSFRGMREHPRFVAVLRQVETQAQAR
jgi:adenylate cyclase